MSQHTIITVGSRVRVVNTKPYGYSCQCEGEVTAFLSQDTLLVKMYHPEWATPEHEATLPSAEYQAITGKVKQGLYTNGHIAIGDVEVLPNEMHTIINVTASGYTYAVDLYEERVEGDSELIAEATHVYVLTSRNDAMLELFVGRELWGNQAAILSEEGEMLL